MTDQILHLSVIYDGETIAGFIGLYDHSIEMLFIGYMYIGKGLGTRLIEFAESLGADSVDVNEQNLKALVFIKQMDFMSSVVMNLTAMADIFLYSISLCIKKEGRFPEKLHNGTARSRNGESVTMQSNEVDTVSHRFR